MTWGSKAEVLEPESLREEIRSEAERMARQYEGPIVAEEGHAIARCRIIPFKGVDYDRVDT